jgi:hypothetical protein
VATTLRPPKPSANWIDLVCASATGGRGNRPTLRRAAAVSKRTTLARPPVVVRQPVAPQWTVSADWQPSDHLLDALARLLVEIDAVRRAVDAEGGGEARR